MSTQKPAPKYELTSCGGDILHFPKGTHRHTLFPIHTNPELTFTDAQGGTQEPQEPDANDRTD